MHLLPKNLALILAGSCLLGIVSTRQATAQNLVYTLSGVTFSDGAVATGFFGFNPTTQVFSNFNITTTSGVSDGDPGFNYSYGPSGSYGQTLGGFVYVFQSEVTPFPSVVLATTSSSTSPGLYPLQLGADVTSNGFGGSGEATGQGNRGITTGSLSVTNAVPEPSSVLTFAIAALGIGGLMIAAKRKKAAPLLPSSL